MAAVSRVVFEYAVLRVQPSQVRGEFVNVGVLVYCQASDLLVLRLHLDEERLQALLPGLDVVAVEQAAQGVQRSCAGAGPAAELTLGQRFRWLTAPRSTVLQAGPVHSGLTSNPDEEADRLLLELVS